jgi:hypothetical protein
MIRKLALILGFTLMVGISTAHAVPVTINVDELYDWGRLYSYNGTTGYNTINSNPQPEGGPDTPIGSFVPQDTVGQSAVYPSEDTWGVGSVASIKTFPDNTTVFQRDSSQELTLMFYGFDDDFLSSPTITGVTNILSVGGHIQVYLDDSPDFNGSLGTAGRTGINSYTGATEGTLVLDLVPVTIDQFGHTLSSNFDFQTQTGSGALYLATTGAGAWDSQYDTNTQLFGSDFSFSFTVRNNVNPSIGDWIVRGDAGGESNINAIPEPASMFLLGSGLFGMLGATRRKK